MALLILQHLVTEDIERLTNFALKFWPVFLAICAWLMRGYVREADVLRAKLESVELKIDSHQAACDEREREMPRRMILSEIARLFESMKASQDRYNRLEEKIDRLIERGNH